MHLQIATLLPLILASGTFGAPTGPLESTPGPYHLKPAPVWPREAQPQSAGAPESM